MSTYTPEQVEQLALECDTGPSQAAVRYKTIASMLRAYAATLRQPSADSGRVGDGFAPIPEAVDAPSAELWAAYQAFNAVYMGMNTQQALRDVITATRALGNAQAEGWRPIETAPKDGTPIFIPYCGRPVPAVWNERDEEWRWVFLSHGLDNAHREEAVKLWHPMPLPTPPQPEE